MMCQILHTPNDVALRERVERNVLLLSRGLNLHLVPENKEVSDDSITKKNRMSFHSSNSTVRPFPSEAKILPEEVTTVNEVNPVSQFLDSMNMPQYSRVFSEHQLTEMDLLREMCNEDYARLGVSIGERIRIQRALTIN